MSKNQAIALCLQTYSLFFSFSTLQEENVNQNLAKYRNAQRDLEDYEERVELAETQVNKYRAKQRSQVTTSTRVSSVLLDSDFSDLDEFLGRNADSDSDAEEFSLSVPTYSH